MACLPFVCDPKVKRGLMPIGVNILLASVLLFRLISLGCAVYALTLLHTDAALQTVHTNFVDSLYVFGKLPLGYMLIIITYSCACAMMPLQTLNSVLGLAAVLFTSRRIMYVHICMSFITIPVMLVYTVLLAGTIRDFYYGIDDAFNTKLNTRDSVANEFRGKLSCCGYSGEDPCENLFISGVKLPGCWDIWSSSFRDFLSTMLTFVICMLILEVLNLVITDYEFRKWRLKEEPERSENTGVLPYIPRDAFGDICTTIVLFWRKGKLVFFMRCLALCHGGIGLVMIIYGAYNIAEYPSSVVYFSISRLRFYNMYFDTLIRILASLLVLCGGTSIFISVQGVSVTCVTSRTAYYVSAFINTGGIIISATVVIFWGVFNTKVRDDMEEELDALFYTALRSSSYFTYALNLVQHLGCCGVRAEGDYINLLPALPYFDKLYPHCFNYRPCAPVLQEHFRTFSSVGLSLGSIILLLQILSLLCVNERLRELTGKSCESEEKMIRRGVFGHLQQRVIILWKEDKINGVSLVLKIVTLVYGVALIVSGLLLRFDDIFENIDLQSIFYPLGFNNRRFTFYLTALAYGMLGLGISEMFISLYGVIIYCWSSKFLVYILIVLRVAFAVTMTVILGLCIESTSNIYWTMYDQLITEFQNHANYLQDSGLQWKLLYFEMKCCGIGNYGDFASIPLEYGRKIPVHCCTNVTEWDPGLESGYEDCTNSLFPGFFHETGCNDVLLDRFGCYTNILISLLAFLILFQILDVVTSARRIHIIKAGSIIDKEIGILVKSVTGKCRANKITDFSEVSVTAEPSELDAGPTLPQIEDSKRNTLLPPLEGGLQPPPSTASPSTETTVDTRRRGKYRRDKRQRQAKRVHNVDVPKPESDVWDAIQNGMQNKESPTVGQNEDVTIATSGRRPASVSSFKSRDKVRASDRADGTQQLPKPSNEDKHVTKADDTKTAVTMETKPDSVRGDFAVEDKERYTDESQFELKERRITTEHPSVIPRDNTLNVTADIEQPDRTQTNDQIHRADTSRDKKILETEEGKVEPNQKEIPNEKYHSNRVKKNDRLDLGESDTQKYLSSVRSGMEDTPNKSQNDKKRRETEPRTDESRKSSEIYQDNKDNAVESGGRAEIAHSGASDKKQVNFETSDQSVEKVKDSRISHGHGEKIRDSRISHGHGEKIRDSGISHGHGEKIRDSGISHGHGEKIRDSGISNGQTEKGMDSEASNAQVEKEINSETTNRHVEELSETNRNVNKTDEKIAVDKNVNDKDTRVNDYDYEDDFSDDGDDDNNNIDFFNKVAGN